MRKFAVPADIYSGSAPSLSPRKGLTHSNVATDGYVFTLFIQREFIIHMFGCDASSYEHSVTYCFFD